MTTTATAPDDDDARHKVVIVGAGFGGNGVIHGLMQNDDEAATAVNHIPNHLHVTLLDRKTTISIGASWQFIWSSRGGKEQKQPPEWKLENLAPAASLSNVDLIFGDSNATVTSIETDKKQLQLKNGNHLRYDTLVVSPGVVSDATLIDGLAEANESSSVLDVCNIQHVPLIKERIDHLLEQAKQSNEVKTILMCVMKTPYKCPPLPFEVVSVLDDLRRKHGVEDKIKILLSMPVPFPFGGPPAAKLFKGLLAEQDITYLPDHVVQKVAVMTDDQQQKTTIILYKVGSGDGDDDERVVVSISADLCLATFPQRAPDFCKPLCNKKGFVDVNVQTNKVTSSSEQEDIYVIGDACQAMFPKPNKPHPKAGEFAYMMGLHVGHQIRVATTSTDGSNTDTPPPARKASCVAECGVDGKGVNVQPNFTDLFE